VNYLVDLEICVWSFFSWWLGCCTNV